MICTCATDRRRTTSPTWSSHVFHACLVSTAQGNPGRRRPSGRAVGVAAGIGLLAVGAVATGAVAAIPDSGTNVITACYANGATKTLRVIDAQGGDTCPSGTTRLSWNSAGVTFRGAYSSTTSYKVNDIVTSGGQTYLARLANTGVNVSNATNWALLAAKGAAGATGATGPRGAKGPQGPQGPAAPTTPGQFVDLSLFSTSTSGTWETVGSTTYTVPAGADVVARFAAESYCSGSAWCSVRILVDGTEMTGGSGTGAAFDDADASSTYEAHSVDRYVENLSAGAHTFTVEAQPVGGDSPFFRLDDDTLVLERIG